MSLGETWVDASFVLPREEQMPVEVRLADGRTEKRKSAEGDWRQVVAWRLLRRGKPSTEKQKGP